MSKFLAAATFTVCIVFASASTGDETNSCSKSESAISIDLRDPEISGGNLITTRGGVVTAPGFRLQGRSIFSKQKTTNGQSFYQVEAEGDLMLEYGEYIFTGSKLFYDFSRKYGWVTDARAMFYPWFIGAPLIELLPDGGYNLHNGYVTASPEWDPDWRLCTQFAYLSRCLVINAYNVQFMAGSWPIAWLPYTWMNLRWILDSPIRYRVRWGGEQGLRLGVGYKAIDWDDFQTWLRFDYRLSRGPGMAIETSYCPTPTRSLYTRNYVARDSNIRDPQRRFRYRLQGTYRDCLFDELLGVFLTYDKISDKDMPFDYCDHDFDLETAQRTQIDLRSNTPYSIGYLRTRVRVNEFETVKEDLPLLHISSKPMPLFATGIVSEHRIDFGYHQVKFSKCVPDTHDYNSTRAAFFHHLYRPFNLPYSTTVTPEAGFIGIHYGNSLHHSDKWVTVGNFGARAETNLYKIYGSYKHVIQPYLHYHYLTTPNTDPDEHFIFGLQDGWYHVNTLRLGTRSILYQKYAPNCIAHSMTADLFAYAFINTATINATVPRLYGELTYDVTSKLRTILLTTWNLERDVLDEYNAHALWTVSDNLAINVEYRHRNAHRWRKVDPNNYILESFHTDSALRDSSLSDRRSTALLKVHYRPWYDWAIGAQVRHGWNRSTQPSYTEYQVDLLKTFRSCWHLRLSYQQRENDHRVACHLKLGCKPPTQRPCTMPYCSWME